MRIPKNYLKRFLEKRKKKKQATSERQELIQQFVDAINKARRGSPYRRVTWPEINGLLARENAEELHWLLGECREAQNFSACFFGKLKRARTAPPLPSEALGASPP